MLTAIGDRIGRIPGEGWMPEAGLEFDVPEARRVRCRVVRALLDAVCRQDCAGARQFANVVDRKVSVAQAFKPTAVIKVRPLPPHQADKGGQLVPGVDRYELAVKNRTGRSADIPARDRPVLASSGRGGSPL